MSRFFVLLTFLLLPFAGGILSAQVSMGKAQKTDPLQTIYIYGVSQNLSDTLVYVSDITVLRGTDLLKKGFLQQREQYAAQFKRFVEKSFKSPHQTAAVFYDIDISRAEKSHERLRRELNESSIGLGKLVVKDIYKDQFVFGLLSTEGDKKN